IVAPSQPMLDVLRSYGVKVKAEVIPTGLQAQSFAAADGTAFREKYQIPHDRPMALYVGRVAFEKNIDFLLRMASELREMQPDVLLVVAGEGPAEKSLHQLAIELHLQNNIRFIGYLDRNTELNGCYKAADVFVFSSKSETQGLVIIEAMAQGTPVVAIAELGTKSILIEGEGALIAPEDEVVFAERVSSILQDKKLRQQLSAKALSYVQQKWTSRAQAERMISFYRQMIAE